MVNQKTKNKLENVKCKRDKATAGKSRQRVLGKVKGVSAIN